MADIDPSELRPEGDQAPAAPARGASVRLRDPGGGLPQGPGMDPANQSLADALRFTYRLLRVGMVALIILFVFSGMKTINEGERGIKVRLGQPFDQDFNPGLHWNWPYPVGEMVRVGVGTVEVKMGTAFMPVNNRAQTQAEAMAADADQFSRTTKLVPGRAGSNITADLNIAHTQWTINYQRTDQSAWARNVTSDQETAMVRVAVQRGVVHTIAGVTIDDLLKLSGDAIAARVRESAQRTLDEMGSGITIERVTLSRKIPPVGLLDRFASVNASAQAAAKAREDALLGRDQLLNEVAGPAAPVLIAQINAYERLIELGQAEEAEILLASIDAILEGRPAEFEGRVYDAGMISGEVAQVINDAEGRVSAMVSQAIADRDFFLAKQAQFESNARLMVARDWSDAMTTFLDKEFVQAMVLPEGVSLAELLISEDPALVRELDRERKRLEAIEAYRLRAEEQRREANRSRRGIKEDDE
ncbi:MAG: SPFH domain-containing protein [Planctomycetota bacterium]